MVADQKTQIVTLIAEMIRPVAVALRVVQECMADTLGDKLQAHLSALEEGRSALYQVNDLGFVLVGRYTLDCGLVALEVQCARGKWLFAPPCLTLLDEFCRQEACDVIVADPISFRVARALKRRGFVVSVDGELKGRLVRMVSCGVAVGELGVTENG